MFLNRFIMVSACSLLLLGCKRKGTVSGTVTNVFDNKPIEGMTVRVTQSAELDPSTKSLQTGVTDANGNFRINATYNTRVSYEYYISLMPTENYVTKDPFFVKDTTATISKAYLYYASHYKTLMQDINDVNKSKGNQDFKFNAAPCGRLRIMPRNVAPAADEDKIEVSVVDKNLADGAKVVYSGKGIFPVTSTYMMVPTNGTVSIKWKVTANSVEKVYYDTIPLAPYSKYIHFINY